MTKLACTPLGTPVQTFRPHYGFGAAPFSTASRLSLSSRSISAIKASGTYQPAFVNE